MPRYAVRLTADSRVRINPKPYLTEGPPRTVVVDYPEATVVVFDRFVPVGASHIPTGFVIQVSVEAPDIETAVATADGAATAVLGVLGSVAAASVARPRTEWVYDITPGVPEREFRWFVYDRAASASTRGLNDQELGEFLAKFAGFLNDQARTHDHKDRVARAVAAFRRAIADNDDPLTEFLILWSTVESLDCVYRKAFPTRRPEFMDGVRDVLTRLGRPDAFEGLKGLRDQIAHGNMRLAESVAQATRELELARKALLLMVMRIIGCEQGVCDRVVARSGYKGNVVTCLRVEAVIRFEPGDVRSLAGHPEVDVQLVSVNATPNGDTLTMQPDWRFTPKNVPHMSVRATALIGDPGANVRVNGLGVNVLPGRASPTRADG